MSKSYLDGLFNLAGKSAVVTGALGQLGRQICSALLASGVRVFACDLGLHEEGMIVSPQIDYYALDVSNTEATRRLFGFFFSENGGFDILINNAGVSCFSPYQDRSEEDFDRVMGVNTKGTFFCIRAFSSLLEKEKRPGVIVNIGSIYGVVSPDFRIYTDCARNSPEVYGASKAAVIQMTKYFAVHLASSDIRVNCVSPGGVFNHQSPQGEDFVRNYSTRCPLGRMANAEEVVGAVLFLSSDASNYVTGQNIMVDGGFSSW